MVTSDLTKAYVVGLRVAGMSAQEIATLTGMTAGAIGMIFARTKQRGFDPEKKPHTIDEFVTGGRGASQSPVKESSAKKADDQKSPSKKRKLPSKMPNVVWSGDETELEHPPDEQVSDEDPFYTDAKEEA